MGKDTSSFRFQSGTACLCQHFPHCIPCTNPLKTNGNSKIYIIWRNADLTTKGIFCVYVNTNLQEEKVCWDAHISLSARCWFHRPHGRTHFPSGGQETLLYAIVDKKKSWQELRICKLRRALRILLYSLTSGLEQN